jgi:hypothetical protein
LINLIEWFVGLIDQLLGGLLLGALFLGDLFVD